MDDTNLNEEQLKKAYRLKSLVDSRDEIYRVTKEQRKKAAKLTEVRGKLLDEIDILIVDLLNQNIKMWDLVKLFGKKEYESKMYPIYRKLVKENKIKPNQI